MALVQQHKKNSMINLTINVSREHEGREERILTTLLSAYKKMEDKDFFECLSEICDHKGLLTLTWSIEPSEQSKKSFADAWEEMGECEIEHIVR